MRNAAIFLGILFFVLFCHGGNKNLALIYKGPGACKGCPETIGWLLQEMGMTVKYLGPKELTKNNLQLASLYVQPGGTGDTAVDTLKALAPAQIQALKTYVSEGGRYLGICAGGYLAGQFWDQEKKIKAFGLLPVIVDAELSIVKPQLIPVIWKGKDHKIYFQYGPYFDISSIPRAEVWATYRDSGHGAALTVPYGKGRVGVIGPHPEATEEWFTQDHLVASDGLKLQLAKDFVKALLNP